MTLKEYMGLTKEQQFYITINSKIKSKEFKNYYEALKYLNHLLEINKLSYDDYWTLVVSANYVYNKGE